MDKKIHENNLNIPEGEYTSPLWLSVSEASKLGGVDQKTIRRAIKFEATLKFKITHNRYQIELASLIRFLDKNKKLRNKFLGYGLGQYVDRWR